MITMTLFYVFSPKVWLLFLPFLMTLAHVVSGPETTESGGCTLSVASIVIAWVVTTITVCVHVVFARPLANLYM